VRGLQADLLMRGKLVKYVKNIVSGTFRALIRQAKADELVVRDVFAGMQWPAWEPPDPDPFTPEERKRIIEWFRNKRFGFHPGAGSTQHRWLPHPSYHAYVFMLFWTGLRPSEASGLRWGDVDLANRRLSVRRSRHLGRYAAPKTKQARREVELFPELARVLSDLQPLHVAPTDPVFKNTCGEAIEPKAFSRHWYDCLRVLDIRQRGLYCTKDTFVTMALGIGVKIAWLEAQTGVRYETLRRHYGKWVPLDRDSELNRFAASDPELFRREPGKLCPQLSTVGAQFGENVVK
jgi:integrase